MAPVAQAFFFLSASVVSAQTPQKLETKDFKVCGVNLKLEIADDESEWTIGLMNRTSIKSGQGMVFIYGYPQQLSFWMKNVPFDIDIGFFNSKGELLNAVTMSGTSVLMSETALPRYPSQGLAQFAVETTPGFFKKLVSKKKKCTISPIPKAK